MSQLDRLRANMALIERVRAWVVLFADADELAAFSRSVLNSVNVRVLQASTGENGDYDRLREQAGGAMRPDDLERVVDLFCRAPDEFRRALLLLGWLYLTGDLSALPAAKENETPRRVFPWIKI